MTIRSIEERVDGKGRPRSVAIVECDGPTCLVMDNTSTDNYAEQWTVVLGGGELADLTLQFHSTECLLLWAEEMRKA